MDVCKNTSVDLQKLISALQELSKDSFNVSDDTILDKLYVYLEKSNSVEDLMRTPEIGDWIEIILNSWSKNEICYGVQIFTIRFIGLIGSRHEGFNLLKVRNILEHTKKLVATTEVQNDSCLMVPLINVFGMFLNHDNGWKWVTETRIWQYTIKVLEEERSIYVKRAGIMFLSLLLKKSIKYDKNIGTEVLCKLSEPLIMNNLLRVEVNTNCHRETNGVFTYCSTTNAVASIENKVATSVNVLRAAKNLCDVLDDLLSCDTNLPATLSLGVLSQHIQESVLMSDILNSCSSAQNHLTFSLLLLMIDVSNTIGKDFKTDGSKETCPYAALHARVSWVISSMTAQGHFQAIINFCVCSLSWNSKLNKSNNCCSSSCRSCVFFEGFVVYCLRIFLHLHTHCFTGRNIIFSMRSRITIENYSIGENLYKKLSSECSSGNDQTQRLCLQYIQLGVLGITRSINFITLLSNKSNVFIEVLNTIDSMVRNFDSNQNDVKPVLLHLLTLASKLIEETQLTYWKLDEDNDENLFTIIIKILSVECQDTRVTVTTLQLLNKTLKFHMMPDLVYKISTVNIHLHLAVRVQVCNLSMLDLKLGSHSWEVRDTTLEVFQTMIELSELLPCTFIDLFQTDLLTNIVEVAANDESSYVRASALNFFSRAVRAKLFSKIIPSDTLMDLAMKTLREDNMPVARRAACELITAIYITYLNTPTLSVDVNKIYEAVFFTTVKDLDWEVKKAALHFWRCTIDKHLMDVMIPLDPHVSQFFKHLKLLKADNSAQIITVLNKLGEVGCLKAIWLGVHDECDLKVSQEAQNIVAHLEELDSQWNFISEILQDTVINEKNEMEDSFQKLKTKEFFTLFQNQEWKQRLLSRKDWIENTSDDLTSLLDHILNVDNRIDDWDHNAVDCY